MQLQMRNESAPTIEWKRTRTRSRDRVQPPARWRTRCRRQRHSSNGSESRRQCVLPDLRLESGSSSAHGLVARRAGQERKRSAKFRRGFSRSAIEPCARRTSACPAWRGRWGAEKLQCRNIGALSRRSPRRPCRSSCGRRERQLAQRRCSERDRGANTTPARGRGGARRRTTENRSARSAAGSPWGQKCFSENACGPLFPRTNLSCGANRPEPHHYAKKGRVGQWRS